MTRQAKLNARQCDAPSDSRIRQMQLTWHCYLLQRLAVMLLLTISTQITGSVASGAVMTWNNPRRFCITDNGPAERYPSEILVDGLGTDAVVLDVDVSLRLGHNFPQDVDVLLVSPTGRKSLVMSDAGGDFGFGIELLLIDCDDSQILGWNFIFSDGAALMPQHEDPIEGSTYAPTNYETATDYFAAPAPSGPYDANLSVFNGGYANGAWQLYVMDDFQVDLGLVDGWSLTITWIDHSPGDTNDDGMVDLVDLNNVRNNFGGTGLGDTDGDADVDLDDLNEVRNNFGTGSTGAVPEPSTLLLLAVAAFGYAVRKRWAAHKPR